MHRIAAGLLRPASGNRLAVNRDRLSRIHQNCFQFFENLFGIFLLVLKTTWSTKTKAQYESHYLKPVFCFFLWHLIPGIRETLQPWNFSSFIFSWPACSPSSQAEGRWRRRSLQRRVPPEARSWLWLWKKLRVWLRPWLRMSLARNTM